VYPEITKHGISFSLGLNDKKNAYNLDFKKDKRGLTTHLDKKAADVCMKDIKCLYLLTQIGQFLKYLEEG
jgi:hypothetical protein